MNWARHFAERLENHRWLMLLSVDTDSYGTAIHKAYITRLTRVLAKRYKVNF